ARAVHVWWAGGDDRALADVLAGALVARFSCAAHGRRLGCRRDCRCLDWRKRPCPEKRRWHGELDRKNGLRAGRVAVVAASSACRAKILRQFGSTSRAGTNWATRPAGRGRRR